MVFQIPNSQELQKIAVVEYLVYVTENECSQTHMFLTVVGEGRAALRFWCKVVEAAVSGPNTTASLSHLTFKNPGKSERFIDSSSCETSPEQPSRAPKNLERGSHVRQPQIPLQAAGRRQGLLREIVSLRVPSPETPKPPKPQIRNLNPTCQLHAFFAHA